MKFLTKLLSEETINTLNEKLGTDLVKQIDEKIGDYSIDAGKEKLIPKSVFDEDRTKLRKQIEDYTNQLTERDTQLKELGEKAKGNAELELQIKNLQESNTKATTDYQTKLKEVSQSYGFKDAISIFKPKNIKALEALIDKTKITYADDGKVTAGLKEQIEALQTSDAYLFDKALPSGTGSPQSGGIDIHTDNASEAESISKIFNNK